ncbi:hypothetical protein [Mechercharimyces sp. CAU 1602]|uniref:hypothetical protein n=1 Tax=Mechercharimyces sp. CAU 1602 TaxID=2973933 RepID=UPI002162D6D0|nr:hypothetical protein [Mechercharimyces sp. CAU 1602]
MSVVQKSRVRGIKSLLYSSFIQFSAMTPTGRTLSKTGNAGMETEETTAFAYLSRKRKITPTC